MMELESIEMEYFASECKDQWTTTQATAFFETLKVVVCKDFEGIARVVAGKTMQQVMQIEFIPQ